MSPFEYHNSILGVQSKYLFNGKNMAPESLKLIGERGFRHRVKEEKIIRLRYQGKNSPSLVVYESLPPEWQNKLIEEFGDPPKQARQSLFSKYYQRDKSAYDYFLKYKKPDDTFLDDYKVEEYTLNASVLNLLNKIRAMRKSFRKELRGSTADVWETLVSDCVNFKREVPHTLPEKARPLYNKLTKYNKDDGGYASIIHKGVCNKNRAKVDEYIEQFLNDMFAEQSDKPTATEITRQYDGFLNGYVTVVNRDTAELYDPSGFPKLGKSTIKNYLNEWRNQIATHTKRSGNRQTLNSKYKPYHSLIQPHFANSIISVDDRQPPFEYANSKRAWFYNAIDLGSEAFTTWVYGKSKEGIIVDFYRQMIRNYTGWGLDIPAEIECEMSLNSSFKNTFLNEGAMFQYVRIEANNARGKRIEAYYRPLRYQLEKKREGWLARPFALSESNQAGGHKVPQIPYEEIIQGSLKDIENWNNMPHSKIKNMSRWEVFLQTQNSNVQPTNWRAILPYLGYPTKTSCRAGIINLQNSEFLLGENGLISYSEELIKLMDIVEGKDLDVYWLDGNDGKVMKALVYLRGENTYICEAVAKPGYQKARIEQKPIDLANREAMTKYVSTVEGFQRRRVRSINPITVIDERPLTLNNKFTIPELYKTKTINNEPEALPDAEEFELNTVETGFNKSLGDRF